MLLSSGTMKTIHLGPQCLKLVGAYKILGWYFLSLDTLNMLLHCFPQILLISKVWWHSNFLSFISYFIFLSRCLVNFTRIYFGGGYFGSIFLGMWFAVLLCDFRCFYQKSFLQLLLYWFDSLALFFFFRTPIICMLGIV